MLKKQKIKKDELDSLRNQLARALADYDNLKKRVEKEREEFFKIAKISFFESILPSLDILYSALAFLNDEGLKKAVESFEKAFLGQGIEKISPQNGDVFDENLHEAIEVVESKDSKKMGRVFETCVAGWKTKEGFLIRPAKVKVYGQKTQKEEFLQKELARKEYM